MAHAPGIAALDEQQHAAESPGVAELGAQCAPVGCASAAAASVMAKTVKSTRRFISQTG